MHWITSIALLLAIYAVGGGIYTLYTGTTSGDGSLTFWGSLLVVALLGAALNEIRRRAR